MPGTVTKNRPTSVVGSDVRSAVAEFNKLAQFGVPLIVRTENLAAGADITARATWILPVAGQVMQAKVLHESASVGIAASPNDAVLTLRNITQAVDIATVTLTANTTANSATTLTLTAANQDTAANDVLGPVVTQGTAADLAELVFVVWWAPSDRVGDEAGTAIS